MSIASIVISAILFDALHIDLTFILFFWAAHHLKQHNPTARKWTLRICGFVLTFLIAMLIGTAITGTDGMTITIFKRIENPSFWQTATVFVILTCMAGIPFGLLLSPQAKREFANPPARFSGRGVVKT
ncbi:MAG: hypothetical protein ACYC26_16135 [Phycisphaerales bacterium]